ncbi:MAG: methionine--tRNA ligase [Candidatus Roizmanbacteria bacterium]
MKKWYITTTLPYVNADPHIGFALEIIEADVLARFKRRVGFDVFFNTGTDEHGLKIYRKAIEEGKDPQEYCNEYAVKFDDLRKALDLTYTNFIRTTDDTHKKTAQKFWSKCYENGDIYKKNYKSKYCVGCELEKTDSELEDGRCPIHPKLDIEILEEENYFFKFSNYQQKLLDLYNSQPDFVIPDYRLKEIKLFVEGGLEDFSISRLKNKMPWGVPVPDDPEHVMYVWFDALVNYISAIGWLDDSTKFKGWWPVVQIAGKDNLRQQSAIWQAMLMSAGVTPSRQIFIHGFITSDGKKMSKSLGNVVSPFDLVQKYGVDATRYYLLREIPAYSDGDFSYDRFDQLYNADLANGLGNLVSRVAKLSSTLGLTLNMHEKKDRGVRGIEEYLNIYRFDLALEWLWQQITLLNKYLDDKKPWKQEADDAKETLQNVICGKEDLVSLLEIAEALSPFIPATSQKIKEVFVEDTIKELSEPLFMRIIS